MSLLSTGKGLTFYQILFFPVGADAPTFDELKDWLREHPDCGILQPGMMNASGTAVSQGATVASTPNR